MTHMSRATIAWGDAGVEQTLAMMAGLIDEAIDTPDVVYFARRLAVQAGVRRPYFQALAIRTWLARAWRFVDDPRDRDLLVSADELLRQYRDYGFIAGDCDEAAILGAALGRAVGFRAQLVVYGFPSDDPTEPDRYSHVFAVLLTDDGRPISLDVTRPAGPVLAPTRSLITDV